MKNQLFSIAILCLVAMNAKSQLVPLNEPDVNKTRVFVGLPDKIPVSDEQLNQLFLYKTGESTRPVQSPVLDDLLAGVVVSSVMKYGTKIQSLIISLTNYPGARFAFSRIISAGGQISFRGRIMNISKGDLYELQLQGEGYFLVKRDLYDLLNE